MQKSIIKPEDKRFCKTAPPKNDLVPCDKLPIAQNTQKSAFKKNMKAPLSKIDFTPPDARLFNTHPTFNRSHPSLHQHPNTYAPFSISTYPPLTNSLLQSYSLHPIFSFLSLVPLLSHQHPNTCAPSLCQLIAPFTRFSPPSFSPHFIPCHKPNHAPKPPQHINKA